MTKLLYGDQPSDRAKTDYEAYRHSHQGDLAYRMSSEARSRFLVWFSPIVALLILSSTLILNESTYPIFFPVNSGLIVISFFIALFGKIAQNQLIIDIMINRDLQNAYNSGRIQRNFDVAKTLPLANQTVQVEFERLDPAVYFEQAAKNWRTHLGFFAPTDTGKTSTLSYFLSLYTDTKPCMVFVVEPKDGLWETLPKENVMRIPLRPGIEHVNRILAITDQLIAECDRRSQLVVNGLAKSNEHSFDIILIIEEYMTCISQIGANYPKEISKKFESNIQAIAAAGRACNVHCLLVSQSLNIEDLKMSGAVRDNFRYILLGNELGGFSAVERAINNSSLVTSKKDRDRLEEQIKWAKAGLESNRQPIIMSNFNGKFQIFPMIDLSHRRLEINSLSYHVLSNNTVDEFLPPSENKVTLIEPENINDLINSVFL